MLENLSSSLSRRKIFVLSLALTPADVVELVCGAVGDANWESKAGAGTWAIFDPEPLVLLRMSSNTPLVLEPFGLPTPLFTRKMLPEPLCPQ